MKTTREGGGRQKGDLVFSPVKGLVCLSHRVNLQRWCVLFPSTSGSKEEQSSTLWNHPWRGTRHRVVVLLRAACYYSHVLLLREFHEKLASIQIRMARKEYKILWTVQFADPDASSHIKCTVLQQEGVWMGEKKQTRKVHKKKVLTESHQFLLYTSKPASSVLVTRVLPVFFWSEWCLHHPEPEASWNLYGSAQVPAQSWCYQDLVTAALQNCWARKKSHRKSSLKLKILQHGLWWQDTHCYKLSQVIILSSKKSSAQSLFWNVFFPTLCFYTWWQLSV